MCIYLLLMDSLMCGMYMSVVGTLHMPAADCHTSASLS